MTREEILSGRHDKLIALFRINLFLYDWLISHSTRIDKHFADFVLARTGRRSR
jgi:hemerythrin